MGLWDADLLYEATGYLEQAATAFASLPEYDYEGDLSLVFSQFNLMQANIAIGDMKAIEAQTAYDEAQQLYETDEAQAEAKYLEATELLEESRAAYAASIVNMDSTIVVLDALSKELVARAEDMGISHEIINDFARKSSALGVEAEDFPWPPPPPPARIGIVTMTKNSNVRAEGNADSAQVGKVSSGESFDCVAIADSGWYQIVLPDGVEGYVSPKMAKLTED